MYRVNIYSYKIFCIYTSVYIYTHVYIHTLPSSFIHLLVKATSEVFEHKYLTLILYFKHSWYHIGVILSAIILYKIYLSLHVGFWNDVKEKWIWELRNVLPKSGSLQAGFSEPFRFCGNENLLHGAVLSGSGLSIISCSCSWKYRNLVLDHAGTVQGFPGHEMQEGRAGLEVLGCFITQLGQQMWTPGHGYTRGGAGLPCHVAKRPHS